MTQSREFFYKISKHGEFKDLRGAVLGQTLTASEALVSIVSAPIGKPKSKPFDNQQPDKKKPPPPPKNVAGYVFFFFPLAVCIREIRRLDFILTAQRMTRNKNGRKLVWTLWRVKGEPL